MLDMTKILADLSKKRPIFHSEADFQHALAWEIHQQWPKCSIRLEQKFSDSSVQNMYLDIYVSNFSVKIAFELKYKTKKLNIDRSEESFRLADQSALDTTRYDFLKDIQRLEQVVHKYPGTIGYAIFLTNERAYWRPSLDQFTADAQFRIHDGQSLTGMLSWGERASARTRKGREQTIDIRGKHVVRWREYSSLSALSQKNRMFKYLLIEIKAPLLGGNLDTGNH